MRQMFWVGRVPFWWMEKGQNHQPANCEIRLFMEIIIKFNCSKQSIRVTNQKLVCGPCKCTFN